MFHFVRSFVYRAFVSCIVLSFRASCVFRIVRVKRSFVLFAFFARLHLVRIVNLYDPGSVLVIYNNLCSFLIYDVSANLTRNDGFRIFAA